MYNPLLEVQTMTGRVSIHCRDIEAIAENQPFCSIVVNGEVHTETIESYETVRDRWNKLLQDKENFFSWRFVENSIAIKKLVNQNRVHNSAVE